MLATVGVLAAEITGNGPWFTAVQRVSIQPLFHPCDIHSFNDNLEQTVSDNASISWTPMCAGHAFDGGSMHMQLLSSSG